MLLLYGFERFLSDGESVVYLIDIDLDTEPRALRNRYFSVFDEWVTHVQVVPPFDIASVILERKRVRNRRTSMDRRHRSDWAGDVVR